MATPLERLAYAVDPVTARQQLGERLWRLVGQADATQARPVRGDVRRAAFFSFGARYDPSRLSLAHRRWTRTMRASLEMIGAAESLRRAALDAQRSRLPRLTDVSSYEARVRAQAVAMRDEAQRETVHAPERYESALRAKLATLRAELPLLHAQLRRAGAENDALRIEHGRLACAEAASRARGAASEAALHWLDTIAGEPITVTGLDAVPPQLDDPVRAIDFLRAVAVLVRDRRRAPRTIAV